MNYYNEIKSQFISNEAYKRVKDYSKNRSDLNTYYNVGKLIVEAQGGFEKSEYGNQLIKEYSLKLTKELGKGYSARNLYNMRLFYVKFREEEILQTVSAKLSWSHINELLNLKNENEINYYIHISEKNNLSVRDLRNKITNKEYERLDFKTKGKLSSKKDNTIGDFIKNPILIKNSHNYTEISEMIFKKLILEDLDNFLTELGEGFTYIRNEYKMKLGDRYNYIDLLLFNINYNCYVVVELKITELKAEHIGQIQKYMSYIDKNVRTFHHDKTIGIIVCKRENKFVMEYCSDERIYSTSYIVN